MTTRRDFLVGSVVTLVFVPACGGGSTAPTDASMGLSCAGTISANHGHVLTILGSDLTTPRDRTYNIQGASDHSHSVMFTAAQMQTLADGGTVGVTSTAGGGHTHDVTAHCA